MAKKIISAIVLSAILATSIPTVGMAATEPAAVTELASTVSAAKVWDGTSTLKEGTKYVLKKSVTINKKVVIPKGSSLIISKGVKLGIGSKGSLYVKGSLVVKSGATLSVSGKFYTYNGSKISDYGKIVLNKNKPTVSLNGSTTVYKTGSISGTPKKLTLGDDAKVTVNGKNTCTKLKTAIKEKSQIAKDSAEIEKMYSKALTAVYVDGNYSEYVKATFPQSMIDKEIAEFERLMAESGESYEGDYFDYMDEIYNSFLKPMFDEIGTFNSASADVVKIQKSSLNADEKALLDDSDLKGVSKVYIVTVKPVFDITLNPDVEYSAEDFASESDIKVAKINGTWYAINMA